MAYFISFSPPLLSPLYSVSYLTSYFQYLYVHMNLFTWFIVYMFMFLLFTKGFFVHILSLLWCSLIITWYMTGKYTLSGIQFVAVNLHVIGQLFLSVRFYPYTVRCLPHLTGVGERQDSGKFSYTRARASFFVCLFIFLFLFYFFSMPILTYFKLESVKGVKKNPHIWIPVPTPAPF